MKNIFHYNNYEWVSTPIFEINGVGTVSCQSYRMDINDFFEKYKDNYIYLFAVQNNEIRAYVSDIKHMPLPNPAVSENLIDNLNSYIDKIINEDNVEEELLMKIAKDFMIFTYGNRINSHIDYCKKI